MYAIVRYYKYVGAKNSLDLNTRKYKINFNKVNKISLSYFS